MHEPATSPPDDLDAETVRLQAEEHPLVDEAPPATLSEQCLRLMHLRAYDEAVRYAEERDVLDVGCNTGYGTMRFTPVAQRIVGVDVSPRAIKAARQRASAGRPEFLVTSGLDLPFGDASFDLVTCFQVLEHVPDPIAFLRELARVIRPGGRLVLATPNAGTRLDPGMAPWNRFHVHEYLPTELEQRLLEVFPQVSVLGMFGAPELYDTEIGRVDAIRRRVRRKEQASARHAARESAAAARRAARPRRPWPARLARSVIPAPARTWLRSMVRPGSRPVVAPTSAAVVKAPATVVPVASAGSVARPMDPEAFLRYSVDDLWYASSDLERAMDLLAICRLDPGPAAGRPPVTDGAGLTEQGL